jgi:hypothetical protein
MGDIAFTNALSFAKFSQDPSCRVFRLTWQELDDALLPVVSSHTETLRKITTADVDKFIKGKPELTLADLQTKLPIWLHDLAYGFLPKNADMLPPHRQWDHKIEIMPGKEPPYTKSRPLSPLELQVVRKWLDENLSKGFIRESRSRCAAPLLLAAKPGGGVRICQDYRGLNNVTIKNRYPLPLVRETLDSLCRARYYTKLDIIAAFNKLRIAEGHEWKTAFITRFGLFESLVMPFGLCNAPADFQHYINHVLFDLLDKTCTAYLDDVLVYSATREEHRQHVREVVQRLADAGLQIDIGKCEFETKKTKYLGLIINDGGVAMDLEKVNAITTWAAPQSLRDLQRFLGFANFYRRFIRNFSALTKPLHNLLKKTTTWAWSLEHDTAFRALKDAFIAAPILAMYDYDKKTILETDASDWASGGVLSQLGDDGKLRPVAYFSAKHTAAECNYEIYDKELLAIIKCLEEWRPELQGTTKPFEILTDHKNLEYFTTTKALNQRQVRWSEFLAGFNFKITYRPGARAVRPDALSRRDQDRPSKMSPDDDRIKHRERRVLGPDVFDDTLTRELFSADNLAAAPAQIVLPDDNTPLDELVNRAYMRSELVRIAILALQDRSLRRWPTSIRKDMGFAMGDCKVIRSRIYYRDRLYVPPDDELKVQIIYRTHSSGAGGHPGRFKTTDLISRTYFWPKMTYDIRAFVKSCELCVRTKASRVAAPGFLRPLPIPFQAWEDISVDYITPLPPCERGGRKYNHIAVVVCRLTKMRHFIATESLKAEELADLFISRVYSLHGAPQTIVSDRGTQFISEFWRELSSRLSITLHPSSAFHPETDGQTERINAILEQYLRAFMNFSQNDWVDWLPLAEFASNNATSETTGVSPFYANYGFHPRLGFEARPPCSPDKTPQQKREFMKAHNIADRFDRILTQLKALAAAANVRYEGNANTHRTDAPRYEVGQRVWVDTRNMKTNRPMKKGDDKWAGPFEITRVYPRACALALPDSMKIFPVFHTSLLRPAEPTTTALPGQSLINEAESRGMRGRILSREDDEEEETEKWEFDSILDVHNDDGHHYLIQWKHHAPSWQPAIDLKGQDSAIIAFHRAHPDKCPPPAWVRRPRRQLPRSTTARHVTFAATQHTRVIGSGV